MLMDLIEEIDDRVNLPKDLAARVDDLFDEGDGPNGCDDDGPSVNPSKAADDDDSLFS